MNKGLMGLSTASRLASRRISFLFVHAACTLVEKERVIMSNIQPAGFIGCTMAGVGVTFLRLNQMRKRHINLIPRHKEEGNTSVIPSKGCLNRIGC